MGSAVVSNVGFSRGSLACGVALCAQVAHWPDFDLKQLARDFIAGACTIVPFGMICHVTEGVKDDRLF